jgi:hypothetical protein
MTLRDDQVIDIFRELPGHRGCKAEELDDVEHRFGIKLPMLYRTMMQLDAARLASAGIVVPLNRLQESREDANAILMQDGYSFRLAPCDVVFAWVDIYAFYFFKANEESDPPVMEFNYYLNRSNGEPMVAYRTLSMYFAIALRQYLNM